MKKVCVLLATYNPRAYFADQIETIRNQKNVEVKIVIRDDASSDKEHLETVLSKYDDITAIYGEKNLGVSGNIKELITYAQTIADDFDYFAYSDQDDWWLDDKLDSAIHELEKLDLNKPALYDSNLMVVDENLVFSHNLFRKNIFRGTIGQSLAQVFCLACTTVFNKPMLKELNKFDFEDLGFDTTIFYIGIVHHNIYFDDTPHIKYRQHGDNVSGQKEKGLKKVISKTKYILSHRGSTFKSNARFVLDHYSNLLNEEELKMVTLMANNHHFINRLKIIFNRRIKAGYQPKDFYVFLKLLINKH